MKYKYYLALTISERIDAFRKAGLELKTDSIFFDKWSKIKGLTSIVDTKKLCEYNNITFDEFVYAIKSFEPFEIEILKEWLDKSEWYQDYKNIMEKFDSDDQTLEELNQTIAYTVRPFVKYFVLEISDCINKNGIKITQNGLQGVIDWAASIFSNILARVITLDLQITKEENSGITFPEYLKKYSTKEDLEKLYGTHPVMTRMITERMKTTVKNICDLFISLQENEKEIVALSGTEELVIEKISFGEGDTHSKGKSVSIITFADGRKVIYKPKRLKIEKCFNELLEYINTNKTEDILDFKYCNSIWRDDYSFCEYIDNLHCNTREEVEHYYRRLGQILFLMYMLNGTDFHYENIIASGEYPYLIDIETLFQVANYDSIPEDDKADWEVMRMNAGSVNSIGILPILGFSQNLEGKSVDISALNGKGQRLPFKVLQMKNANTTEMIYEYDYPELSNANNIPFIKTERQSFADYHEHFVLGFRKFGEFVLNNKAAIIDKINELFKEPKLYVRQLTKATANYATLLSYFNHPNYLSDMMYMERLFENLMSYPYSDKRIVPYEINDMLNGDIPIFFSELSKRDILSSDYSSVPDYFKMSPIDRVVLKLKNINDDEIQKQMDMILSSIGEKKKERIKWINNLTLNDKDKEIPDKEKVIGLVSELNNIILSQRVFNKNKDDFTWVHNDDSIIQKEPINFTFESGLSGLSRYFSIMGSVTDNKEYNDIGYSILKKVDILPYKFYESNYDYLSILSCFLESKEYSEKYSEFLTSIGRRIIDGSVSLNEKQLLMFSAISKSFVKQTNNQELNDVIETVENNNNKLFYSLSPEEMLFCFSEYNDENKKKIIEYGEKILSVSPKEFWSKNTFDGYSDGILFAVNNLVDISNITGDTKYIDYSRELMKLLYLTYIEHKRFRLMFDIKESNVSLAEGLSGVAYTFERVFVECNLPNIFNLKV